MKSLALLTVFCSLLFLCSAASSNNRIPEQHDDDQVCVILERYGNRQCHGGVQSTNTFVALTHPGTPCKHNANMKSNSVKDQYCEVAQQLFHQTVFVSDKHCHVNWAQKAFSPMHLQYTQKKCTYGYKLKSCTLGACPEESVLDDSDEEDLDGMKFLLDFHLDAEVQ
jgi:hypothetical protein